MFCDAAKKFKNKSKVSQGKQCCEPLEIEQLKVDPFKENIAGKGCLQLSSIFFSINSRNNEKFNVI